SLPLAVAGGVLTAPLAGGLWSIGALAGLFAVLALAIRDSVMLGFRIRDVEQAGTAARRAGLAGGRERAVPVLQPALITAAALIPAVVLGAQAGLEFLHPLAVMMLGALVSLVLVQLFVLPALLLVAAGEPRPDEQSSRAQPGDVGPQA